MLTTDFVKKQIKGALSPKIQKARDMNETLRLHVDGDRDLLTAALERINNYENEEQYKAREKHAISNRFITDELLRPTDNAFNAKGGSKNYLFETDKDKKEQELKEKLTNVKGGYSLSDYIEKIWFHKFVTDPNGLILMETPEVDEDEIKLEPCYKSINSIRNYEQNGIYVDWVIFEPYIEYEEEDGQGRKTKIKVFWAVDELNYYKYRIVEGELTEPITIPHDFEKVPAILCSDIVDNVTGMKLSPISAQIELLQKYMVSNSVLSIAEFSHNYPREWMYVDECRACNGTGESNDGSVCHACDGTKKATRDVTNINELRVPQTDGVKIDPPSGYVYLPVDSWKTMVDSVDRYHNMVFFSHWGTTISKDAKNETATGRFIDAQPVNNRLEKYSRSIETAHTALADLYGKYYFPETFQKSEIKYGDRYLIETPDQIWEKYLTAKEKNAPVSQLNLLLYQFIESEYKNKPRALEYEIKKMSLEPFVHWDIETVRKSDIISQLDKAKKEYFNEWCFRTDKNYIIDTNIEKLDVEFTTYVESKIETNGQKQEVV